MNKTSTLRDFEVIAKLGQGSFSSVFKVRRCDDQTCYALKKVKMGQMCYQEKENALNEVRILASISHPNIINYKEAFFDDSSETLCIVMEIAEEGDVLKKINEHIKNKSYFKESEIWKALIHMTRGLKCLHDMTILHRDLKCANVFCTKDNVFKLGDLNVSKVTKKAMARTHTGTPYYTSPEVWKDRPYDLKCDIWSLACVIYEMAALKPPFRANNLKELYNKIQKGIFDRIPSFYSDDLQNMINMCMKVNPAMRPNTDQILGHPTVLKNTVPSEMYLGEPKKQCNLLKTIAVPKNLKSLKEALPASKYEIETNFEKQALEKKIEARLNSVRSLGRVGGSVETPKIQPDSRKYEYISAARPDSAQRRPESAQRRPESANRRDEYSQRREESSSKKLPRVPSEVKNRNNSYDQLKRDNSRQGLQRNVSRQALRRDVERQLPRNRSRQALQQLEHRNHSKEIRDNIQKYIKERNCELKRNQSEISTRVVEVGRNVSRALEAVRKIEMRNKEIITQRRLLPMAADYKPRSQSFEKENKTPAKRATPAPTPEGRYALDRKYLPPRQFKL